MTIRELRKRPEVADREADILDEMAKEIGGDSPIFPAARERMNKLIFAGKSARIIAAHLAELANKIERLDS